MCEEAALEQACQLLEVHTLAAQLSVSGQPGTVQKSCLGLHAPEARCGILASQTLLTENCLAVMHLTQVYPVTEELCVTHALGTIGEKVSRGKQPLKPLAWPLAGQVLAPAPAPARYTSS